MEILRKILLTQNKKIRKPYGYLPSEAIRNVCENIDVIIDEWEKYSKVKYTCPIDDISIDQKELNQDKKWKAAFLFVYGEFNSDAEIHFPQTMKIIKNWSKEIKLVFFSKLEAHKHIPAHHGNNFGVIRNQIGINILFPEKTGLRVADKTVQLKKKELFIFDDTFEHEAWNNSETDRVVLIIDTCKKFSYLYNVINKFLLKKLKKTNYIQSVIKKII